MGHDANNNNRLFVLQNKSGVFTYNPAWDYSVSSGAAFGSLTWADFNNDGLQDLAVLGRSDKSRLRIYLNSGDITNPFQSAIEPAALNFFSSAKLIAADYDNDGDVDLLALMANQFRIFDNQFMQVGVASMTTVDPGLPGVGTAGAAWGDFNNDGLFGHGVCRCVGQSAPILGGAASDTRPTL